MTWTSKQKIEIELSENDWRLILFMRSISLGELDETPTKFFSDIIREGLKTYRTITKKKCEARGGSIPEFVIGDGETVKEPE